MPELRFSIIIPVFNRATQIKHCIDSVLSQDYPAFEVIVVDDGSTDATAEVIRSITDQRLRYVYQENKERGAARNNGWNQATGDYVTFLDSDDEFLPGHLSKVAQHLQAHPGIEMLCTAYFKEGPKGTSRIAIPDAIYTCLADGNFLSCNGVFLSANIQSFRFSEIRELSGLEDWLLWLQIAKHKRTAGAQLYTSRMRHHDNRSVLQTDPVSIEKRFELFFAALEQKNKEDAAAYPMTRIRASGESYMALHLALTGKYKKEARKHLRTALRLQPALRFTRRYLAILKNLWL